jgi:hypothetical protein
VNRQGDRASPSARLIGLPVLVVLAFALAATPAFAARGHVFDESLTLGEPCPALEVPCGPGKLKEPSAVAVNEASGDVYVLDQGNSRVEVFDGQTGALVDQFDGAPGHEFDFGSDAQNASIAIDNSCLALGPACESADESSQDVYVLDPGHRVVDKFSANGEYLSQITANGAGPFSEALDGVAVDSAGGVWVCREGKEIDGYTSAEPNAFLKTVITGGFSGFGLPGFAVDSAGNFYLRHNKGEDFIGRIAKVAAAGNAFTAEVEDLPSSAVAVEARTDVSFIQNLTSVAAFSPEGVELERLGTEGGAAHLSEGAGIGVDSRREFLYVADRAANQVAVFEPELPGPPSVESESTFVSAVSAEAATLHAEVNPRSEAGEGSTTYSFQYGPCTSPASCATSPFPLSSPAGSLLPDFEPHLLSATLTGLQPGTLYHYRLSATNQHGTVTGEGEVGKEPLRTFATQPLASFELADSRQWQLVSPPDKRGALIEPISEAGVVQAAAGGGAITYLTNSPTELQPPGAANKTQVLSSRGAASWSSLDISIPHNSATGSPNGDGQEYKFFDRELSLSAVQPFGEFIPQLSEEASESTAYLRSLSDPCANPCFRPLVTGKPGFANVSPPGTQFGEEQECTPSAGPTTTNTNVFCGPEFLGASEDLSHVVLRAAAPLKPGAGSEQLYEWSGGSLAQVSLLPNGQPAEAGARLGLRDQLAPGAISADGSRVVWELQPGLYLRDITAEETVQLDEAQACGACVSGGGRFQFANADGSRVFFTDTNRLTPDSGAQPGGSNPKADLYECEIVLVGGKPQCTLADLTPINGGEGAEALGQVLGASEDGSFVYFVARGVQSDAANERGEQAAPGRPNLYLHAAAGTSFITTLSEGDTHDWGVELNALIAQPTRVSPDGQWLELMSQAPLTGYDNRDAASGKPVAEVYLYRAGTDSLRCASCDPTGARPVGVEYRQLEPGSGGLVGGPRGIWPDSALVAANVPGRTAIATGGQQKERYQSRYLSDAGRLFFNAHDGLVAADSNGTEDVYEYEPPGVGGCTESSPTFGALSGGCVELISSGTSGEESAFLDASESGEDVFFLTASRLTAQDSDNVLDVYDAHVCTAKAPCLPEPPSPPIPCSGEACQAPGTSPAEGSPSTQSFVGPANPKPNRQHHKKKHKKHHAKHKRAGHNRRAQR